MLVAARDEADRIGHTLSALGEAFPGAHILVADDGSGSQTVACIQRWQSSLPFPLIHTWQEDRGFRAAAARNRAAARSQGDYLVFLDGDCVAFPDFLCRHRALAERGWFVAGNRVLLDAVLTEAVLRADAPVRAAHRQASVLQGCRSS